MMDDGLMKYGICLSMVESISTMDIHGRDISAMDIHGRDISTMGIHAGDILYHGYPWYSISLPWISMLEISLPWISMVEMFSTMDIHGGDISILDFLCRDNSTMDIHILS